MKVDFAVNRLVHLVDERFDGMIAIDLDAFGQVNVRVLVRGMYSYAFAETLNPDEHPEVNSDLIDEFWNSTADYTDTRLNVGGCLRLATNLIDTIVELERISDPRYGMVWADWPQDGGRPAGAA